MMMSEPDYEAATGLIKHRTTDELRELVQNDNKVMDLIKDLPQMKNLVSEQELLLTANKSLAEYNLSLAPKLNQAKQILFGKYEEASKLTDEMNLLKSQVDSSSGQYSIETVHALLQTAVQESEEETEKIVEQLLGNNKTAEEFITEFLAARKTAYLRRVKSEKIVEISARKPRDAVAYAASTNVSAGSQWGSVNLPYPTQPGSMPMPGFH